MDYYDVFDNFPDGIIILSPELNVEYANESALGALNLTSRRQLLGKKITDEYSEFTDYFDRDLDTHLTFTEKDFAKIDDQRNVTLLMGAQKMPDSDSILFYIKDVSVEINLLNKFHREEKERKKAVESSLTDSLTGCLNKEGLFQSLDRIWNRIKEHGGIFSILVIDMDDFKTVNDTYGHQAGDDYLAGFADMLRETLRDRDLLARFGGDEFVAVLKDCTGEEAESVAQRMLAATERFELDVDGKALTASLSIGVSVSHPGYQEWQEILKKADEAVYAAKEAGKNTFEFIPRKVA